MRQELGFLADALIDQDAVRIARAFRAAVPRLHWAWAAAVAPVVPGTPWDGPAAPFAELLAVADALVRYAEGDRTLPVTDVLSRLCAYDPPIGVLAELGVMCFGAMEGDEDVRRLGHESFVQRAAAAAVDERRVWVRRYWRDLALWSVELFPAAEPAGRTEGEAEVVLSV